MADGAFGWVPAIVRQHGEERSDADGMLALDFAPVAGQTRLVASSHRMPMQVQRAQYRDSACPDMATVPLLMIGGGVLQGDRIRQSVRLAPGARVCLTTPAATKIYRMERGYAAQEMTLSVADGATLEYLPAPIIVQHGARYAQRTTIIAAPTATVLCGEILIPGRIAMGERGVYDVLALITERRDGEDGQVRWRDALVIEPAMLPPGAGAKETIGTLFALAPITAEAVHAALTSEPAMYHIYWGTSDLPDTGIIVRIADEDSHAVQAAQAAALRCIRSLALC